MGNLSCCTQSQPHPKRDIKPSKTCPSPARVVIPLDEHKVHFQQPIKKYQIQKPQAVRKTQKLSRGPEDYQHKKYLGKGSFGFVVLAEQKLTNRRYAMKIINKSKIKEFNVMQCQLMKQIGHKDFLVGIKETFQTDDNIYIIMQYFPMGDLYFYLRKKEVIFTEEMIRDILAEIVVGISYLHSNGIIYRELKPQNLMVTQQGHIKLTDYGLSKVIIENKQFISTFIGPLQYMAPQALKGEFGQKADFWAIGVLMFELMFKQNPLECEYKIQKNSQGLYESNIGETTINDSINSKIGYMSLPFRDLLRKLLEQDPDKRISLKQIFTHDFFKGISWSDVQSRKNQPPLKQLIQKHDYIKFRDPTAEEYIRKQVIRRANKQQDYQIKLYQFRNSQ